MATDTTTPGLFSALHAAISDPGRIVARDRYPAAGTLETVGHWSARAAALAVEPFLAKPAELSDSERFRVEEAREALAAVWDDRLGDHIYGTERTLHDHAAVLLALVDKLAPEETADGN